MNSTMEIQQEIFLEPLEPKEINNEPSDHSIMSCACVRLLLITAVVKSILGLLILFLLFVISIIVLIIGLHFRHSTSCPVQPKISIFLIVAGITSAQWLVLSALLSVITIIQNHFNSFILAAFNILTASVIIAINIFLVVWLILGSIWTLEVLETVQHIDRNLPTFCEATLYRFTLGYLVFTCIFSALQCWYRLCVVIFCSIRQEQIDSSFYRTT